MGNINDYALTQFKRIVGDTGSVNDSVYLPFVQQAIYDVDSRLQQGMSVVITGNSYALTPAPAATSSIWNIIARCAVWRYRDKLFQEYLDEMEGMGSVRDEVTSFSRNPVIKAKEKAVADAKDAYEGELFTYTFSATSTAVVAEELGLAESDTDEDE